MVSWQLSLTLRSYRKYGSNSSSWMLLFWYFFSNFPIVNWCFSAYFVRTYLKLYLNSTNKRNIEFWGFDINFSKQKRGKSYLSCFDRCLSCGLNSPKKELHDTYSQAQKYTIFYMLKKGYNKSKILIAKGKNRSSITR